MPFGFARTLSWISLILIVSSSLGLAVFLGKSAHETLLRKQQDFALLLAENLNHQIYRRFTLPTLIGFGRIALRQPVQYERLDQVIQSTIHGLHVDRLRIYDHDKVVSYSSDESDLGRKDLAPLSTEQALQGDEPHFEIVPSMSFWRALFLFDPEPGSYLMRTIFPLRIETRLSIGESDAPVMGVLEITQDISSDLKAIARFQWLIILTSILSSIVLFAMLRMFIRRAEQLYAERTAAQQQLELELHQHEKLASMGRVISSIAHEIRNPLGIIRSSAELLLKRSRTRAEEQEAGKTPPIDNVNPRILEAIYDESVRLSQTINDFLDYARPRKLQKVSVDVSKTLEQVLTFLEPEIARCAISISRTARDGFFCEADNDLLYRAFYNVLINGIQAIEAEHNDGGVIDISLHEHPTTEENPDHAGMLEVRFVDSGAGFTPESKNKLLDPFFTTKDHGTGLGLPIVNSIITSHGGSIELENAPQGGAVVRIFLPSTRA